MTRALATVAVLAAFTLASIAQTAFTYQGQLQDGGQSATGTYDLRATLYDAATGGAQLGEVARDDVAVDKGLFTVSLDFGVLTAGPRWLEIAVRRGNETGAYTPILPRQNLAPSPFAITAYRVAPASVTSEGLAFDGGSLAKVSDGVMRLDDGAVVVQPSAGVTHLLRAQTGWYSPEAADQHAGYGSGAQYGLPTAIDPNEWQSFQPGVTGLLTAAQLRTAGTTTGTWTFTLEVREGEGATGALLASTPVSGGMAETLKRVTFEDPPTLQAGTTYSLVFANVPMVNPRPKLNGWYDQYANGRSGRNATYDFAFDTYMKALNTRTPLHVAGGSAWGLGIGSAPADGHRLDVAGSLRATGFVLPTGAGTGKVLTSDAAGAGTWQAPTFVQRAGDTMTGTLTLAAPAKLSFGSTARQMLNLHGTGYGLGVQSETLYQRSNGGFAWFKGGTHSDTIYDPGTGGAVSMVLTHDGKLGIGTSVPTQKVQVDSGDLLVRGPANFADTWTGVAPFQLRNPGKATLYLGDADHFIQAQHDSSIVFGIGGKKSTYIDTGANLNIGSEGTLKFGDTLRQAIQMGGGGLGMQTDTLYQRSAGGFAWFKGGAHSNTANDPGTDGVRLMRLTPEGNFGLGLAANAPGHVLHVGGYCSGGADAPLARFVSIGLKGSAAPALGLVSSGSAPNGVLNLLADGGGKFLSMRNTTGEVASLDTAGLLTVPSATVKNALSVEGAATVVGNATIQGNASVQGNLDARNLPAAKGVQSYGTATAVAVKLTTVTVDALTIDAPGPGKVVVQAVIAYRASAAITLPQMDVDFTLVDYTSGTDTIVASAPQTLMPKTGCDASGTATLLWTFDVTGPSQIRVKTRMGANSFDFVTSAYHTLTAMYFPKGM